MSILNPIIPSFASGELSPLLYSRVDLEKFKSGLRTGRNIIIHPQGGVSNRNGFGFIEETKYPTSYSVAQEFIFSQDQAYVLEFGHRYIRFYTDGAQIQNDGVAYEVATEYDHTDVSGLKFEGSADVVFITDQDYKTKTLTRYGNANWVLEDYDPDDGPFMPENTDETISLSVSAVTGNVTLSVSTDFIPDPNIVVLLHLDGTDGATTFTDEIGKVWTASGNAQIDTAYSVFGGASLLLDGNDNISTPSNTDFDMGTGPFKVNFRVRQTTAGTLQYFTTRKDGGNDAFNISITAANKLEFLAQNSSTTIANYVTNNAVDIADGNWHAIEMGRSGSNFYMFLDGTSLAITASTPIGSNTMPSPSTPLYIGSRDNNTFGFIGNIDEFRIMKGTAPHTASYTVETSAYTVGDSISDYYFNEGQVGGLFKLSHYIESQSLALSATGVVNSSSIKCFTTWRLLTHGTWTAKFRIEKSDDNGTTWTELRSFSGANDYNVDTFGTEDIELNPVPFLIRIAVYNYTSGTLHLDLSSDPFYQDGIIRITGFNSVTSLAGTVLQTFGSTDETTLWAEGSWSDYRGYPAVARFFQDRLVFASSPSEPQTDWMSVTGNYYSFLRHQELLDTDGISTPIPSRQLNAINSLLAFKKLLQFTLSAIWSTGPTSGSALTPTSIQNDVEEYSGASPVDPVVVGNEAIYVQGDGETVRNVGFSLADDSYIGSEISVLANHLFQGYSITKMAYQRNPNSIVWCVRSDGVLLSLTYMKEQNVVGWTHHDTDGLVESICVIPGTYGDELWAIINRDGSRYIERQYGRKAFDLDNSVFLDSYIIVDNSTSVITAAHLANQVITYLGDDSDTGTKAVSSGGTFAMSSTYTELQVGLPFTSDVETLNIEVGLRTGTLQGTKIKVGNVIFRFVNTRGGYVGPNSSKLYEAFTQSELQKAAQLQSPPYTLGNTEYFNGDIRVPLGAGYEDGGRIFYRQTSPFGFTIAAIIPEFQPGGAVSGS